jgi:hypothetical protein
MANICFRCKEHGHWAAQCPQLICEFCGHQGHWASKCEMKNKLTIPVPETRERVSRLRSRATLMTIGDIMFNCHLNKGFTKEMGEQVKVLMKSICGRDRDEVLIAEYVLEENRESFMIGDAGHMEVLGFIIKRYLSADNDVLKTFLRGMHHEAPGEFYATVKNVFGLVVVNKANGTMCFRKPVGWGV